MDLNNYEELSSHSSLGSDFRRSQSINNAIIVSELHSVDMHNPLNFPRDFNSDVNPDENGDIPISRKFADSPSFNFGSDHEMDSNEEEILMSARNFSPNLSSHSVPNSVINDGMEGLILPSNNDFASKSDFRNYDDNDSVASLHNIIEPCEANNFVETSQNSDEMERPQNIEYECISTILNSDTHFKGIKIPISSDDNKHCDFYPTSSSHNTRILENPVPSLRKYSNSQNIYPTSANNIYDDCEVPDLSSRYETENPLPSVIMPDTESHSQGYLYKFNKDPTMEEGKNPLLSKRRCSQNQTTDVYDKPFPSYMINRNSEIMSYDMENPLSNVSNNNISRLGMEYPSMLMKKYNSAVHDKFNASVPLNSESTSYDMENTSIENTNGQGIKHLLSMRFNHNQNVCSGTNVYDKFKVPATSNHVVTSSDSISYKTENPLPTMKNASNPRMGFHKFNKNITREGRNNILNPALQRSMMSEQSTVSDSKFKSKLSKNLSGSEDPVTTFSSSSQRKGVSTNSDGKEDSSSSSRNFNRIQNKVPISDSDICSELDSFPNREKKTDATSNFKMVHNDGEYSVLPTVEHTESLAHPSGGMTKDSDTELFVLSVYWRKGFLGAAYYSADATEIHVIPDIVDVNPEFNILHSLYTLLEPSKVIVPAQMPETFLSALKSLTGYGTPVDVQALRLEKKLHILPRKEYNLEGCRRRVLLLQLPSEPEECNEDEHLLYLNSLIDMTNESMTQALGVLLKWLDMSWGLMHLDQQKQPPVLAVNILSLKDLVMIDRDTYEALQIFSPRPHPSGFKRGMPGSFREGLSVFGIFNRCKSPIGCKHMRVMLRHPTRNIDVLKARLDVVQFCIHPNNEDTVGNMIVCLKNIKSVTRILSRLTRLSASIQEWKSLHKTIYYCVLLGTICEQFSEKIKIFAEIANSVTDEMQQIEYSITKIIDFKQSEKQNSFVVNLGIDEVLDRKKQEYGGIPNLMTSVAHQELEYLPSYINECSLVYIPEIGYLLAIFAWKENMTDEDWDIPQMEFMFKLGGIGHYKSARCRELDEMLGDTLVDIMKVESLILLRLVQFIQQRIAPLHKLVKKAAELDCLIALASVARENNYCRPELTLERILEIRGGRHPLQELCVDNFVPNDTFSGDNHTLMKIITGPNSSGKSVYLKQVTLIAYLAHIGSFVPAEVAKIGILDHIHTRIQTVESVASNISAFVIDLRQMLLSLYNSTPSSLIIVDEFGKGTTEVDGLALLASCLDHFLSRKEKCPHILAATHFHNVINLIRKSKYLNLQTMACLFEKDGQVVNLFKLKEGSVETSCALAIAETVLGTTTSARAEQFLDTVKTGKEIYIPVDSKMDIKAKKYKALAQKIVTIDSSDYNQTEEINRLCDDI